MTSLLFGMQFLLFLLWHIWGERNVRRFDDQERRSSDLRTCFLKALLEWISTTTFLFESSYAYFCSLFYLFIPQYAKC